MKYSNKLMPLLLIVALIFQIISPISTLAAEGSMGIRSFPAFPENTKPIDISNSMNATGSTVLHSNHLVDFTGPDGRRSAQIWSKQRINLNDPFSLEFYVYLGDASKEDIADGIALTFRNGPDNYVGNQGIGIGSYGKNLGKAHVLEFDTYYNGGQDKELNQSDGELTNWTTSRNNHVGHVAIRTTNPNGTVNPHQILYWGNKENPLANGKWNKITYKWDPHGNNDKGLIKVSYAGKEFNKNYDIRKDLANPNDVVWGLTSSTGVYQTNQGVFFSKAHFGYGVELTKVDSENGEKLQGAIFELRDMDNNIVADKVVTDASGHLIVKNLVPGSYKFYEKQAPEGYALSEEPVSFSVKEEDTERAKVEVKNKKLPDKVADKPKIDPIKETDKEITGTGTPGDKIIVRDPEGKVIGETTVDKDGKWKLEVPEGTKLKKGEDITATSKKPGSDKESEPAKTVVTGEDKVADKPKIDPIKETDKEITGTGTSGDKIVVRDPKGKVIGETSVDKDGKWKLEVPEGTKLKKGEDITATSKKPGSDKENEPAKTVVTGENKDGDNTNRPGVDNQGSNKKQGKELIESMLPKTGGESMFIVQLLGGILVLFALLLMVSKRKKHK